MMALTLWPEWAWAIAWLDKRVENREWRPGDEWLCRRFAIHAGKNIGGRPGKRARSEGLDAFVETAYVAGWDLEPCVRGDDVTMRFRRSGDAKFSESTIVRSGVVAVATLEDVIDEWRRYPDDSLRSSPWFVGRFGWVLSAVVRLPEPVMVGGAQRLWSLAHPQERAVVAQLSP
jgi:hypothetical protein